jgi:hypothetical protein
MPNTCWREIGGREGGGATRDSGWVEDTNFQLGMWESRGRGALTLRRTTVLSLCGSGREGVVGKYRRRGDEKRERAGGEVTCRCSANHAMGGEGSSRAEIGVRSGPVDSIFVHRDFLADDNELTTRVVVLRQNSILCIFIHPPAIPPSPHTHFRKQKHKM